MQVGRGLCYNAHMENREKTVVKTGIVGIVANVLLAGFKAAAGLAVNSIAMVLDAVNNLSDALSSVITIIGTKIAGKKPDKKHPLGHGRVEYLSQMAVALLILYAGITALVESVKKIISPEPPDHNMVSLIIIGVAIVVKIFLGLYFRKKAGQAKSELLKASGTDALFDAVLSTAVLISAIIFIATGFNAEAYVSILISIFILKAGYEMIREAVDDMLGHRVEGEYTQKVKEIVSRMPGVYGVYDVILHNYGPDRFLGSLHVEVDDTVTAKEFDQLTRDIVEAVYEETAIILTAVGLYSRNTGDDEAMRIRNEITRLVMDHDNVIQMHGFYIDEKRKRITFDIVIDFDEANIKELYEHIVADVKEVAPGYEVKVSLDADISDLGDD